MDLAVSPVLLDCKQEIPTSHLSKNTQWYTCTNSKSPSNQYTKAYQLCKIPAW